MGGSGAVKERTETVRDIGTLVTVAEQDVKNTPKGANIAPTYCSPKEFDLLLKKSADLDSTNINKLGIAGQSHTLVYKGYWFTTSTTNPVPGYDTILDGIMKDWEPSK